MRRVVLVGSVVVALALTLRASPASAEVAREGVEDAQAEALARSALVFTLYESHAASMRRARYGRAVAFGVLGAGAVITAASGIPEDPFARSYLAIVGTGALLGSLLNLGIRSSAEHTARQIRSGACCSEPSALHARWTTEAKRARTTRTAFGVISAIYGVTNATLGVLALTLDDPTFTDPERSNLAAFGLLAGTAGLAGAALFFMTPSGPERALAQYEAIPSALRTASISLLPIPGGAAFVFGGTY